MCWFHCVQEKCQDLEVLRSKVELLESREWESLAQMNVLSAENVDLETKVAVCC